MKWWRGLGTLLAMLGASTFMSPLPAQPSLPPAGPVKFERDIEPILSARCLTCHGPSKGSGGLRFIDRSAGLGELNSGNRAIVPGDPDRSELLKRVAAHDPKKRMPPKGEPLAARQIELLRQWIAQGAVWPEHWAYRSLRLPTVRSVTIPGNENWTRTPIDRFILAKLHERGLRPSPEADKRTWLRRVSFDLTGLPPTVAERDAFLVDDSPNAHEKVVDRLLASPHYGERWARHWMDLVHFAETHGHDQDRPRPNAWPYRDYLIRSLNNDKPYARFVQEQVAGDVLYPNEPDAIIATGLLAAGPWDESSLRDIRDDTIDREIARYLDRDDILTTVMATFTSTTVHCARCHDHKFDPIPQMDYYRLQAVFAGVDKADRPYDADLKLAAERRELADKKARLAGSRERLDPGLLAADVQAEVAAWEKALASERSVWTVLEPVTMTSASGATLTKQADGSVLSTGARPLTDTYTFVAHTELMKITGVRLEVLTDDNLPMKGPGRQENGNLHLNEFQVFAHSRGRVSEPPGSAVRLCNAKADFNQEGWTVGMAIDGKPHTAWGIFPEVGQAHFAVFEFAETLGFDGGTTLTFRLEQTHGGGHLIGRPRLSVTAQPPPLAAKADTLPTEVAAILAIAAEKRSDRQRADLAAYLLEQKIERAMAALPPPRMVYSGNNRFKAEGTFKPAEKPRTVHLLQRGEITKPDLAVGPGALSCVSKLEADLKPANLDDEGSRRAALAQWLTDPQNVLTWRSIVNRVWQHHFGRGLVATPSDFGRMGAAPTHPELLDWLALTFRDNGGSFKKLHKLIVLSAVYRQSSGNDPRSAALDADNQYVWRMPRTRLDAESVRDAVLLASGKLDRTMGGPSVKQFIESPGVHVTPVVDYQAIDPDHPANFRRSVYRFIFRTLPDPFMDTLDCPDASQLTPVRTASVTPLQALAMLNNKFIIRQSEHLAARAAKLAPDLLGQVHAVYELTLCRPPTAEESKALVDYAKKHGLANACRVILNSNEFMFVN